MRGVKGTAVPHGNRSRYTTQGCRCEECTAANTDYQRVLKSRLAARPHDQVPHGLGGYRHYRCRCEVCKKGHREEFRAYRHRRRITVGAS